VLLFHTTNNRQIISKWQKTVRSTECCIILPKSCEPTLYAVLPSIEDVHHYKCASSAKPNQTNFISWKQLKNNVEHETICPCHSSMLATRALAQISLLSAAQNEWNIQYSLAHTLGDSKYFSVKSFSISIRDEAFNINLHHSTSKNRTTVLSKWLEL